MGERKEHEEQLWCYEQYEAVLEAAQMTLWYEEDGLISHDDFDRVKRAVEAAWDEGDIVTITGITISVL